MSLFHRFDVRAFAWDAQEVRQLRAVLHMDVDAVYCDRPQRMVETVAAWEAEERAERLMQLRPSGLDGPGDSS